MPQGRSPTVYLFVNKDRASSSLSRSQGKDASAILSHVQSCRNQKNKQLHMFRVDDINQSPSSRRARPPPPQSSSQSPSSSSSVPTLRSQASSNSESGTSSLLSPASSHTSASPQPLFPGPSRPDELINFFDTLCLTSSNESPDETQTRDLYHQIILCEDFCHFPLQSRHWIHENAILACTAAKMATDKPGRREEFMIKTTEFMQPSLQYLREQLADPSSRVLTDREILREMLLHCVTNWYLGDWIAAQTHLKAMSCFTGCLDLSASADCQLMDIISRCSLQIAKAQNGIVQHRRRDST